MNSLCNYYSQIEVWLIYKIIFDNSRTKQMQRIWRETENILKFKPIIEPASIKTVNRVQICSPQKLSID